MIVISAVRLRRRWLPWLVRFVLIMGLIYVLTAAYHWFGSTGYSSTPRPSTPTLYAAVSEGANAAKENMVGALR